MATLAAVTINDGQATPVAHTFTPIGPVEVDGTATLLDKSGGVPIGYGKITASLRSPVLRIGAMMASTANRVYKARYKIDIPTMESTSAATGTGIPPAPTVAYVHGVDVTFTLPERGTMAERKNILAYAKNLLADAIVSNAVWNLEGVW